MVFDYANANASAKFMALELADTNGDMLKQVGQLLETDGTPVKIGLTIALGLRYILLSDRCIFPIMQYSLLKRI